MIEEWARRLGRAAAKTRRQVEAKLAATAEGIPLVPVSVGELIDKLTNVERERKSLAAVGERFGLRDGEFAALFADLKQVNEALWEIEDEIRDCERRADFGPRFVELARSVYRNNDRRAALKGEINRLSGSALVEEKSYKSY